MQQWIELHKHEDPARLLLRHHGEPGIEQAVTQIECRRRAASKLPGFIAHKAFMFPHSLSAEQCTAEIVAGFHNKLAGNAKSILDMTAGLGIDAMTLAKSRDVVAIDMNLSAAEALKHNAGILGIESMNVLCCDSCEWLRKNDNAEFNIIFIDPARRNSTGGRVKALTDCTPDVTELMLLLLNRTPKVMIKASPMLDIKRLILELNTASEGHGSVSEVYSVGTAVECKELLAIVERGIHEATIYATTLLPEKIITTAQTDIIEAVCPADPKPGMWLYEPYPSVMKLGSKFKTSSRPISKLDRDTNLYLSDTLKESFPGLGMKIINVVKFSDKNAKELTKDIDSANILTRNFIISAPELARRIKVKEGGEMRIYGTRANGRLLLILTEPPIRNT